MKPHSQRCITKSDIDTAAVRAIFHCLIKTKHHGYQSSPCQAGPGGKFSVYIFIMCPLSPEPASSPHAGVEWPGGRAAPSPSGQKRPKVVAPSPRTSRPPAGPPATTSLSPRPLFRGPAALRGRDGPAFACETCGPRQGEKGHHHRSVSGLLPVLSSSRGGEGRKRERMRPPESLRLGGRSQPLAGRRCPVLWPGRPLSDQLSSQRSACLGGRVSV